MAKKETKVEGEEEVVVEKEQLIPMSEVKKLFREMMANEGKVEEPDKPSEHVASLCRLDGKWVVDFKDYNTDPYIQSKVESVKKLSSDGKEYVSYITVVFDDATEKEIPLNLFMRNLTPIQCVITERKKKNVSYSIGEVEKTEWVNDRKVGTGVMIDQKVTMFEERFVLSTPDGKTVEVPGSVINLRQAPKRK